MHQPADWDYDTLVDDLPNGTSRRSDQPSSAEDGGSTDTPGFSQMAFDYTWLLRQLEALSVQEKRTGPPVLSSFDLEGVAEYIKEGKAKKIICMCGAGISVSAGIPDFRTPGFGLYSKMEKYNLSRPEDVFSISYFRQHPEPFIQLAKELMPGTFEPTPAHYFIALLQKKGLLLRCYSQNIDSLETLAGLPMEYIVAAHGNFDGAHCIDCSKAFDIESLKDNLRAEQVTKCTSCGGLVKPDIVFFGEPLPPRFFQLEHRDTRQCDMLIVMGTSLLVQPFAGLVGLVGSEVPRLLINKEVVGESLDGFDFSDANYRDAKFIGTCDDGILKLAELLGWKDELDEMMTNPRTEQKPCGDVKPTM